MSKLKHTPGPWIISDDVDFDSFISGPTGKFENVICSSPRSYKRGKNGCKNYKPWHDNKLLIAAAPEMLEALIMIYKVWHEDSILISSVKAIIEKATGLTIEEILNEN